MVVVLVIIVAIGIVSKGAAMAILLTEANFNESTQNSSEFIVRIAFWIGTCVLPSFLYVSTYIVDIILLYC